METREESVCLLKLIWVPPNQVRITVVVQTAICRRKLGLQAHKDEGRILALVVYLVQADELKIRSEGQLMFTEGMDYIHVVGPSSTRRRTIVVPGYEKSSQCIKRWQ